MKSSLTAAAGGLVLATFGGVAAHAQDSAQDAPKEGALFGRSFNIALRGWVTPTYEGGKHFGLYPGGSLAVTRPSDFDNFAAPDDAASFALLDNRHVSAGIAAAVRENRYNNDELTGMRSIGWSIQGGGYVNIWPTRWLRLHVEGLKGLTSQYGVLVNTSAEYKLKSKWRVTFDVRYHHLLGDDANSPLVKQLGTADQFQASTGFRVLFPPS